MAEDLAPMICVSLVAKLIEKCRRKQIISILVFSILLVVLITGFLNRVSKPHIKRLKTIVYFVCM